MELKQVCREILEEARRSNVNDLKKFNQLKLQVLARLNYDKIPKNATIASMASEKDREKFNKILSMKPVRTLSGVAPIALMTDPYPCPHTIKGIGPCTYCPGGPGSIFGDVPQSYTGKEPSTRRAIRNHYDPYIGVFNRLEHYVVMGSVPEKTEVILQGGTFPFAPFSYQGYFVKYLLKAMNDFSRLFYKSNELDKEKFNLFFELPANIEDNARTERLHKKILFIKNLDLGDNKILSEIANLFFRDKLIENKENNAQNNEINKISNKINNGKTIENNNELENEIIRKWEQYPECKHNEENLDLILINKAPDATNETDTIERNPNIVAMKSLIAKVKGQNNPLFSLENVQKTNETAKIRCIGLTIETKSDYGKLLHGNQMLKLGCTRIEIGVQSIYDEVLQKTNRGNTVQDNIESIRILKDLGFKINAHYMPGLPYTTKEMDKRGLKELFENPDYRPDMLKIYPCMVMPGTRLYDDWKAGTFNPLTTKEAAVLIAEMFSYTPEWCRVMRVQRDIPTYATASGVDRTNLRQYVDKICRESGIKSRDIRAREAGFNYINRTITMDNVKIKIIEYKASHGKEFFIAAEIPEDILIGYCRLRFPSQFLREEITETSSLVRELHIYSLAVSIGKQSQDSFQHRGIGKKLMEKAEEIAKNNGKSKIIVIAGIGAKQYFAKIGYNYDGPYMSKILI